MKVTVLGTGTSTGVPAIGCACETCTSKDARDKRLRVSILVEEDGQTILVDTSTDFRQQALRAGIKKLDAVLITHCHADHIFGLDDIRPLNFQHGALGVYANERAWRDIRRIFKYVFEPSYIGGGLPQINAHTIEANAPFCLSENLIVTPLEVLHGRLPIVAYRFNDFAYVTDVSEIPPEAMAQLRGLDALILDALRVRPHPTHFNVEQALAVVKELKPRRAYFTHMSHEILHARDSKLLPPNVEFAYDGLEIEI